VDYDVEAMFLDAENDEGLSFKKIGDLDVGAMEREAEERHRRATPLTPHPVMPSSSPAREGGTSGNGAGGLQDNKGKGKDGKKRPRPVLLNENLLLGTTGFPDLISQVRNFKVKGKGREVPSPCCSVRPSINPCVGGRLGSPYASVQFLDSQTSPEAEVP
jgi:replication fork protection complex subunit Csm3/Swi3